MATPVYLKRTLRLLSDYQGAPPRRLGAAAAAHIATLRAIVAHPDIVGLGIAGKVTGGVRSEDLALVFYVRRKSARSRIPVSLTIPPVIAAPGGEAIFTDVVEIGDVRPSSGAIISGRSTGHRDSAGGTLGAVVNHMAGKMVLSNAHVLALSGQALFGDPILMPAADAGGKDPADRIAELAAFRPFKTGGAYVNRSDAALARLFDAVLGRVDPAVPGAGLPLKTGVPQRGKSVMITGHASGPATSTIVDADATVQIDYPGVGLVGFKAQVLCESYTAAGDSGSLVIDTDSRKIVGLHFAHSDLGSYFTPISTVMADLGFSF